MIVPAVMLVIFFTGLPLYGARWGRERLIAVDLVGNLAGLFDQGLSILKIFLAQREEGMGLNATVRKALYE